MTENIREIQKSRNLESPTLSPDKTFSSLLCQPLSLPTDAQPGWQLLAWLESLQDVFRNHLWRGWLERCWGGREKAGVLPVSAPFFAPVNRIPCLSFIVIANIMYQTLHQRNRGLNKTDQRWCLLLWDLERSEVLESRRKLSQMCVFCPFHRCD